MALIKGVQGYRYDFAAKPLNEEIFNLEGYLSEEDAKIYLYKFLRNNVTFAAELLLGVKLFPFQALMIKGMMIGDFSMFVLSRGGSKCSRKDDLVFTKKGIKKIIDVEVGDEVQSLKSFNRVEGKTINEKQKIWEITTDSGYSSGGLDYHRTLIFDPKTLNFDWRFSKDLKIGDIIPIRKGFNLWPEENQNIFEKVESSLGQFSFDATKRPIKDWYYFFGLLIGDGHYLGGKSKKTGVGLTTSDYEIAEWAARFVSDVTFEPYKKPKLSNGKNTYLICLNRKLCREWMISLGFNHDKLAYQKIIPYSLLENSKENVCSLISGLFDTDGYCSITENKQKKSIRCRAGFTSSSSELILQVQNILLNLGIESSKIKTFKGGNAKFNGKEYLCREAWSLLINNCSSIRIFDKEIGFRLQRKDSLLKNGLSRQVHGELGYNKKIPIQKYIETKYGRYFRAGEESIKLSYGSKSISKPKLEALYKMGVFDKEDSEKILKILELDIYFDKVKEVKEDYDITVDIQVANEHCYVSNGFISHNSFIAGVFVLLDLILNQGSKIGVLSSGFRQCLKSDSLVFTDNGLTKLENVSIGDWIQAREGKQKVVDKWSNPTSESLIVKTKRGFEFEAKIGHRLLAYNKDSVENVYKKIEDLQIGEILPIQTNQLFFGDKNPFDGFSYEKEHHCRKPINLEKDDLEFYYFLGMLIAEGSVYKTQQNANLSLVSEDIECLIRIQKYLKSIAPENSIPVKERKGREGTFYLEFSSSEFISLLSHIGYDIYDWVSFTKEIPYKILGANKEKLAALLQGMFDGDGGIHLYKKTPNSAEIKYTTSSKVLADQIRTILLNFGIVSKLLYNKAKKRTTKNGAVLNAREHWNIKITGKDNIRTFHERIGFYIPRKKDQLDNLISNWNNVEKNNNTTSYVYGFGDFLKGKISKQTARYHGFCSGNLRKNIGYSTIKRICEDKSIPKDVLDKCENLLKDRFYYDEIVSITPSTCETIDIEVENEHCYFGNGFIHHNSKFILLKCQDILNKKGAAIANSCGFKFTRGTDQWTLTCGRSEAIALPLADGSKIRGFRFKKLLLDEFLNIPKNIFQEVILPFLGVVDNPTERTELSAVEDKLIAQGKMTKEDKFIWPSNKLIILSSPSFKFEYMYQVYCQYRDLIMGIHKEGDDELTEKDAYRIIFQMGYDCLPLELYDANLLKQAKATMSEMAFTKEFGGQFVDESDGYFRLSKMVLCTVEEGSEPTVEVAGSAQDKYIVSFDPSWAENSDSDDFAIEVFKLHDSSKTGTLVHAYGLSGASLNSHIEYMAYILLNFNVVGMCGDYMGGLQFVNACNESETFKEKGLKIGLLEGDFDDPTKYEDDLKEMKRAYRPTQRSFCYLRQPSSNWIREANELLQANIDHKRIHFAAGAHDSNFEAQRSKKIPVAKLKWDNKFEKPTNEEAAIVDFIDHQKSMIELTKAQCANIEVITNPQGSQTFRLPLYMTKQKGPDRPRKDNYSALVLGNWFIKVYYDMIDVQAERVFESFTPTVIK